MAIGRPIELTPNIATKNISSLATDSQTQFTVTGGYRINEIAVYRNGVRLAEGRDFTASDGDTVNLVTAAEVDDIIEFAVFDSFNVSDAIVSAASSQNLNGDFNVTGIFYAGDFKTDGVTVGINTVSTTLHVGSALTANAAGDVETIGIITASRFVGDVTGTITGAAAQITVADESSDATCFPTFVTAATGDLAPKSGTNLTFNSSSGALTATSVAGNIVGGTGSFSGAVNVDDTTDSTSATTGALIVDGGLGVAKNVYIGAGLSVAGTLTYEDVTSVDSVGLITAKSGVNITGGELTVGSGITMGIAGVATFSGTSDVHLHDNVKLNVGDASDFQVSHDGSDTILNNTTGALKILSDQTISFRDSGDSEAFAVFTDNGSVDLYYNNSKKFETTNDGTVTTGISTADGFSVGDNEYITAGIGSDLALYHDSSDSWIVGNTGSTIIAADSLLIKDKDNTASLARFTHEGDVKLYYSGSEKLKTSNDGTVTTGIATATGGLRAYLGAGARDDFSTAADGLIIEKNGDTGISIDPGASGQANIYFPNASNHSIGSLSHNNSTGVLNVRGENIVTLSTNSNTERLRINSSGKVFLHGTSATSANDTTTRLSNGNTLNIHGTSSVDGVSVVRYSATYGCYGLNIAKSNNDTLGTNTLVTDGEELGHVSFYGADGTDFNMAAQITAKVDGTPSGGTDMPGALSLRTSAEASDAPTERLKITSAGSFQFSNGALTEKVEITAGKLSDNADIDLADGMVHYFTTTETTTSTPNIRLNGSTTLNSIMTAGDVITVTLVTTAAAAGYSANVTIDGNAVTEEWVGGSAPSAGGSDGLDIYVYTIICIHATNTGDSGFKVIANLTNAT